MNKRVKKGNNRVFFIDLEISRANKTMTEGVSK